MTTPNNLSDLTAVIYVRKSTESDGKSLRDQERECRDWCAGRGIVVDKVFVDNGISASKYSKQERPQWEKLKRYLRSGHILVAWEQSRLTRNDEEWAPFAALCVEHGIPLSYGGRVLDLSVGDDYFQGGLDALLSVRESAKTRERVQRAMRGTVADCTPHARPPWGYRRKAGTKGSEWEPDPVEAPRVREAVKLILAGESRRSVLQWLKSTGYAPATSSALTRVICNPQLAGQRIHKGKAVGNATWEPIISMKDHKQLVRAKKANTVTPGPEPKYLCSGIVKCGKCGLGVCIKPRKPNPLYGCPKGHTNRKAETVDNEVKAAVLRRLKNINPADYDRDNPEVAAAIKEIEDIETDLAEWEEKALAGEVSAAMFAKIEKDRLAKIKALQPRTVINRPRLLDPESWETATLEQRREVVRALLDITLPYTGQRGNVSTPRTIDIRPK